MATSSTIYNRQILGSYWQKYRFRNLSMYEDVRISYYFACIGNFLENQNSSLYSWRISEFNMSNQKKSIDRLRLISWIRYLEINKFFKFIILIGAKIQYFFYYKNSYGNLRLNKIFFRLRNNIIKYRSGT